MKLWELPASKNNKNVDPAFTALVVAAMRRVAPLLEYAEFYSFIGSSDTPRKSSGASGGQFRALNSDFPDNRTDITRGLLQLATFGDKIQMDQAYERREQDIGSIFTRELERVGEMIGRGLQYAMIRASASDPNSFNGILNQIPSGRTMTHAVAVNNEAGVRALVEKIRYAVDETPGANFILMDSQLKNAISTYADKIMVGFVTELGRQIMTVADVPVVIAGKNASGIRALPWTPSSASSTTSVIVGYSGEQAGVAFGSNVGIEVRDQGLVGTHYETSIEVDVDLDVLNDEALYVISGIPGAS